MSVDTAKLQFYSGYPIDKVVVEGTTSYSVAGSSGLSPTYSTQTITNSYATKGFINLSWSVDNSNFYDQNSQIQFYSQFRLQPMLSGQVQGGVDTSSIYFFIRNGLHDAAGTPTTQTFYIKYAVYAIS